MARSDLLVGLVRAASRDDGQGFRRALEALVADERAKQHHVLADRLSEYLAPSTNGTHAAVLAAGDEGIRELLHSRTATRQLESLTLPSLATKLLAELIEEQFRKELLRSHGLEPRHRLMLIGPPGNGKTSVAEGISEALMLPLFIARYEGIVGSYLGETSNRLKRVFDFVRTRPCVLFFDEFDTLGKERGDPHDTGEIKRVVSALLLQIDDLPSHVVVVTATNHAELLDRAAWRRFELRIFLPPPTASQIEDRVNTFLREILPPAELSGQYARDLTGRLLGASFSDLEMIELDVRRRMVLTQGAENPISIIQGAVSIWFDQQRT